MRNSTHTLQVCQRNWRSCVCGVCVCVWCVYVCVCVCGVCVCVVCVCVCMWCVLCVCVCVCVCVLCVCVYVCVFHPGRISQLEQGDQSINSLIKHARLCHRLCSSCQREGRDVSNILLVQPYLPASSFTTPVKGHTAIITQGKNHTWSITLFIPLFYLSP